MDDYMDLDYRNVDEEFKMTAANPNNKENSISLANCQQVYPQNHFQ